MGRALGRAGDGTGAAIYLARAARPQPGALTALDPLATPISPPCAPPPRRRPATARPRSA